MIHLILINYVDTKITTYIDFIFIKYLNIDISVYRNILLHFWRLQ